MKRIILLLVLQSLLLCSCGDSKENSEPISNEKGTITLSEEDIYCFVGENGVLTYTVSDNIAGEKVKRESADDDIVSITAGYWQALKAGLTFVTAYTESGAAKGCLIHVYDPFRLGIYQGTVYDFNAYPDFRITFTFDTFLYGYSIQGNDLVINLESITITFLTCTIKSGAPRYFTPGYDLYLYVVDRFNKVVVESTRIWPFLIDTVPSTKSAYRSLPSLRVKNADPYYCTYRINLDLKYNK